MQPTSPIRTGTEAAHQNFVHGTVWVGLSHYANYATQLVLIAILARLLAPADFGIIAMVLVYTGFASIFVTSGFAAAVIQDRQHDDSALSTLFWSATILGLLLILITFVLANWMERIFESPGLAIVIRTASPVLLFSAASSIPAARLQKILRFRLIAVASLLSALLGGAVAITAALAGAGYWALVLQILTASLANAGILLTSGGWVPRLQFDSDVVKRLGRFSSHVIGFGAINYWGRNADNFLIGRYLGASSLGLYDLAYKLMFIPQMAITNVISRVLHPALAAARDEPKKARELYFSVLNIVTRISFMTGVFMAVMAPEIIHALWGPGWEESVPVLRWLSLVSILQVPVATSGAAMLGSGRSDLYLRVGLVTTFAFVVSFVLTVRHGIVILALGYLLTNILISPIVLAVAYRLYSSDYRRYLRVIAASVLAGIVVGGICLLIQATGAGLNEWGRLLLAAFASTGFGALFLLRTTGIAGVLPLLRQQETDQQDLSCP